MANEQNLQLLKDTDNSEVQAARGRKGGLAKSEAKRLAIIFAKTKCKNCNLPCPLKDEGTKEGWVCKIPDTKRLILEASVNPEKLKDSLFMDAMQLQTIAGTDFNKLQTVFYAKLNLKKEIAPSSVNQLSQVNNFFMDEEKMLRLYERFRKVKCYSVDAGSRAD